MLNKLYKFFNCEARIFYDTLEGFWRDNLSCMKRHNYSAVIIFKLNMAAFLADTIKSSFIKRPNGFFGSKSWKFLHQIAISTSSGWNKCSLISSRLITSGSGSKYNAIASFIFLIVSLLFVPQEWQHFKDGQYAWYPSLFGSFSMMILSFITWPPIEIIAYSIGCVKHISGGHSND